MEVRKEKGKGSQRQHRISRYLGSGSGKLAFGAPMGSQPEGIAAGPSFLTSGTGPASRGPSIHSTMGVPIGSASGLILGSIASPERWALG